MPVEFGNISPTYTGLPTGRVGVPEPASMTLLAAGMIGLGLARSRRRGA